MEVPAVQDNRFFARRIRADTQLSVKQCCVMQARLMMLSLLHLRPWKLLRILDPALYIPPCLLFLASTGVLPTLQAAVFLISLVPLYQVFRQSARTCKVWLKPSPTVLHCCFGVACVTCLHCTRLTTFMNYSRCNILSHIKPMRSCSHRAALNCSSYHLLHCSSLRIL